MDMLTAAQLYATVVQRFTAPIIYSFAYGSGVFPQAGYSTKDVKESMLDVIFVVDDAQEWHGTNLKQHPNHYSHLVKYGWLDPAWVQKAGSGVYFNTNITLDQLRLKYGVVELNDCLRDLNTWQWLYVAGRMHKPILDIISPQEAIVSAQQQNLFYALNAALLMLPESFSTFALYSKIVSLSFCGDIRVGIAENPNKIGNIVNRQVDMLEQMYADAIARTKADGVLVQASPTLWHQDKSPMAIRQSIARLAPSLCRSVCKAMYYNKETIPAQAVPQITEQALRSIVKFSSLVQSAKGLLTANPSTSLSYLLAKLRKRW